MKQSLHILAVEPYYGGSHRAFLDSVVQHSRHRWTILTEPSYHWKWRMRSAPLSLATKAVDAINKSAAPDAILCTDMLDVTCWLGLLSRIRSPAADVILKAPLAVYFHENQWTHPTSPTSRPDHHYGYTNLTSAIAADVCWFNSSFHKDDFLAASEAFVRRMPDTRDDHDLTAIHNKSSVIYPGFNIPAETGEDDRSSFDPDRPLRIGWVSRWEFDKRPDEFLRLLYLVESREIPFQLILLGERKDDSDTLNEIRTRFHERIIVDEFAETREQYISILQKMDVVVSTADHEFFGIAVCEAIASGAAPVLPNRLSYRELIPQNVCYESIEEAANMIAELSNVAKRITASEMARRSVEKFRAENTVLQLDDAIEDLACT